MAQCATCVVSRDPRTADQRDLLAITENLLKLLTWNPPCCVPNFLCQHMDLIIRLVFHIRHTILATVALYNHYLPTFVK